MRKGGHSLPSGWVLKPIRRLVDVRLSNVDKKTVRGQDPVRLCNYTDVYYGSFITDSTEFMSATASDDQRRRFLLQPGDVLITKDSESNEDIARPAVVAEELDSVVCGYHLALLRPHSIDGRFLYWALSSAPVNDQFTRRANGVTRFGLTSQAIKSVVIPVPPVPDQCRIDRFLTARTKQIDEAIAAKKRLVQLLEEERQVVIADATTKGFDRSVALVESNAPWLGEIPAHWDLVPARAALRPSKKTVGRTSAKHTLLSLTLRGVIQRDLEDMKGKFPASFDSYQIVEPGDFVFCLFDVDETPRTVGLSAEAGMITSAYDVYKPTELADSEYLYYLFLSFDHRKQLKPLYRGLRKTIPSERFAAMKICLPPREEQHQIVQHIESETSRIDRAVATAERQIELLEEYRAALIADAVTGKLDLSAADSRQLDTAAEEAVEAALAGEPS